MIMVTAGYTEVMAATAAASPPSSSALEKRMLAVAVVMAAPSDQPRPDSVTLSKAAGAERLPKLMSPRMIAANSMLKKLVYETWEEQDEEEARSEGYGYSCAHLYLTR